MAVNKNFVVKNGFEVNNNLIYADANTNKVGIGSTGPRTTLDVRGGIAVTDINAVGIVTIGDRFYVGNNGTVFTALGIGGSVGVGTNLPGYLLDVRSSVSTGQTAFYVRGDGRFTGNLSIQGDLSVDDITIDQADLAYLNVTGFGTAASLFVPGTASIKTGIVTNISGQNLNYSGFSSVTNLNVNGTFDSYAADSVFHGNVTIDGNVTIGGTSSVINAVELRVQDKDIVLGFTTSQPPTDDTANHGGIAIASTEGTPLVSLQVVGINTLPDTYKQIMWVKRGTMGAGTTDAFLFNYGVGIGSTQVPNDTRLAVGKIQLTDTAVNAPAANLTNLNVSGVSTLGTVLVSSGIVTATSGIVTYYGDGSKLQNISAGIGIGTIGGLVGYGATFINFYGPGVSTAYYSGSTGIATVYFEGGGGGAIGIGSTFPGTPASLDLPPSNGDLFFHINYGRTFIYYDEDVLGIGSTAVWIDASPFNVGIVTVSLQSLPLGSVLSPSFAYIGDPSTGLYSPLPGHQTFVSAGNPILNINPSGINVTGITTLGNKVKVGVGTTSLIVEGDARITGILTIGTSSITSSGINAGVITATSFFGNLTGNVTGTSTGLSGSPNITVGNIVGSSVTFTNLTVNGTQTIINTTSLEVSDKTIGIGSTSTPSDSLADGAGIIVYGNSNKSITYNNTKRAFETNVAWATTDTRFINVSEKLVRVDGNTVNIAYNSNSANIGLCTNPSGNITLNVTGIPTDSSFDNHTISFSIIINQTGTARSCTAVTLNGVSETIFWSGGSLASAISGVTTTSGYDIYSFTGINTVGSASTAANYVVFGSVSGGFR
jgi:hypothetical protein